MSSITKKVKNMPRLTGKTKVSYNRSDSKSLKTTIPENIAEAMELKQGDMLTWELDLTDKDVIVMVAKQKQEAKKQE